MTQLHDVVFVVYAEYSTIVRFNANTRQRLTDIDFSTSECPCDIAACEQTSHVYVADFMQQCIWRVSADGAEIRRWLPKSPDDTFGPRTLSVTSTRLLVTSLYRKLMQFDADGNELRRVHLPDYMMPHHAVESPTGTFVVCQHNRQTENYQINEVNAVGEVLRQFSISHLPSVELPGLTSPPHVAVDSRGNILVEDDVNGLILLLDAHLTLRRVIVDEHQLNYKRPWCLCYTEQSGQLLVGISNRSVAVFDVLR